VKTVGDGLLLEFLSVVDAVECAVAMQAVMAQRNEGVAVDHRMLFRIGVNLGDILIEGDDILGDGVNIAARLDGIAQPGGICLSASACDRCFLRSASGHKATWPRPIRSRRRQAQAAYPEP
jgi:class 3 adenylate cyclase